MGAEKGKIQYFRTPRPQRAHLPFFDRPYFWVPTMVLLVLIFIKDTLGGFAPLIKKPLDAIEVLFVNHAALILIVFPVVMNQVARVMGFTSLWGLFAELLRGPVVYAATVDAAGVHHAFSVATAFLYTAAGFVLAGVVGLLGHCFDVLAMISPLPFVDFLLKLIRNIIFAVGLGATIISPHLGMLLSLVVIIISCMAFGWALRLSVFGIVFAWSMLQMMLWEIKRSPAAKKEYALSVRA